MFTGMARGRGAGARQARPASLGAVERRTVGGEKSAGSNGRTEASVDAAPAIPHTGISLNGPFVVEPLDRNAKTPFPVGEATGGRGSSAFFKVRPPPSILPAETEAIRSRLDAGAAMQFTGARRGAVVDVVIGLDFGTSATKVVVRAPYVASVAPHALPIPDSLRAEGNPHLWRTGLWIANDDTFSVFAQPGAIPVENIKMHLMGSNPERNIVGGNGVPRVSAWEASVAYLAFVFRYTRGWFLETKQAAYRRAPLAWQGNVGLPAATYDDPTLTKLYRQMVAAAWILSQQPTDITLPAVRRAWDDPRAIAASGDDNARAALGVEIIPEVAAEVVGFARSTRRREGLYVMIDVGGGTLDVCTFRLHSSNGTDRYSMFTADVQPQGAEILRHFVESGGSSQEFAAAVTKTMRRVIWDTKLRRDPRAEEWRDRLPIFLCGGGRASLCHREAAEGLGPWLAKNTLARGAPILALDCPEGFDVEIPAEDFHRLAVAWGLSYPRYDIGDLHRPSEIEDVPKPPVRDLSDSFVSKDHL